MKLYAKVTSERASKGQGGNDKLEIEITGENRNPLAFITVLPSGTIIVEEQEGGKVIIEREWDYARRVQELEAEGLTTSDAQGVADVEESKLKGEKQKGEKLYCNNCKKETMTDRMGTCSECKHDN